MPQSSKIFYWSVKFIYVCKLYNNKLAMCFMFINNAILWDCIVQYIRYVLRCCICDRRGTMWTPNMKKGSVCDCGWVRGYIVWPATYILAQQFSCSLSLWGFVPVGWDALIILNISSYSEVWSLESQLLHIISGEFSIVLLVYCKDYFTITTGY